MKLAPISTSAEWLSRLSFAVTVDSVFSVDVPVPVVVVTGIAIFMPSDLGSTPTLKLGRSAIRAELNPPPPVTSARSESPSPSVSGEAGDVRVVFASLPSSSRTFAGPPAGGVASPSESPSVGREP